MKIKKLDLSGNKIGYISLKRLCTAAIISGNIDKLIVKNLKITKD